MTEVDIRTHIKIMPPGGGLSFLQPAWKCFDLALWNVFRSLSGLPLIYVALFYSCLGWMDLLLSRHLGWIITLSVCCNQVHTDSSPFLLSIYFLLFLSTGLQQKQSDSGGKKQVLQPTARRKDLYQRILHRPQHLWWLLALTSDSTEGTSTLTQLCSFLCALYWDTWLHMWDSPTLRLLVCNVNTVLPTEENTCFLSRAYTWIKEHCFFFFFFFFWLSEADRWISQCGQNGEKSDISSVRQWEMWSLLTLLWCLQKRPVFVMVGNNHKTALHDFIWRVSFCMVDRIPGLRTYKRLFSWSQIRDWFWKS